VFKTLLKHLESPTWVFLKSLLLTMYKSCILLLKEIKTFLAFLTLFATILLNQNGSVIKVLFEDFELFSVSHVADCGLKISENRLQKHVLLLNDIFLVKELLHCLMISLLSKEGKVLKLLLILSIVQDSLRKNDIFVYFFVQRRKRRPFLRIRLHNVEHQLVIHGFLGFLEVQMSHLF